MTYVFTYGTLRPSLYGEKYGCTLVGPGQIKNLPIGFKMYNCGRFPALVPSRAKGLKPIVGEVVSIGDLVELDRYEGYQPGGKGLYDRRLVEIDRGGAVSVEAWVYFMQKAHPHMRWIRSGDWTDVVNPPNGTSYTL
jgi:gamma-glutamylcyclotransferase (GGCT)/AIG2-like uncharacterized protein YtfP